MKKVEIICDGCKGVCETGIGIRLFIMYGFYACHLCNVCMDPVLIAMRNVGIEFGVAVEKHLMETEKLVFSLVD